MTRLIDMYFYLHSTIQHSTKSGSLRVGVEERLFRAFFGQNRENSKKLKIFKLNVGHLFIESCQKFLCKLMKFDKNSMHWIHWDQKWCSKIWTGFNPTWLCGTDFIKLLITSITDQYELGTRTFIHSTKLSFHELFCPMLLKLWILIEWNF